MKAETIKLFKLCERLKELPGYCYSYLQQCLSRTVSFVKTDALQTCRDGLAALRTRLQVATKEVRENKRFRAGLLVGLLAIPAWKSYLFFDIETRIEGFYYVNYVFYFNTIRAYLAGIFLATGFFICAPQKWAFKWWALPVVIFCVSEIYSESYYTDYTDFYQPMPLWQDTLILMFCLPAFFFSIDYLLYRKYHLKDGTIARMKGIIALRNVSAEQKMQLLEQQALELENFNQRY